MKSQQIICLEIATDYICICATYADNIFILSLDFQCNLIAVHWLLVVRSAVFMVVELSMFMFQYVRWVTTVNAMLNVMSGYFKMRNTDTQKQIHIFIERKTYCFDEWQIFLPDVSLWMKYITSISHTTPDAISRVWYRGNKLKYIIFEKRDISSLKG